MHVRKGKKAPVTPTLMDLANEEDPMSLINDLFIDKWRPWIAIYCGDGRWADKVSSAITNYNAGGTDQISVMGSVSMLSKFIREGREDCLDLVAEQIRFANKHHNVTGIQLITHPLCGATKQLVTSEVPGAENVYSSPTKAAPELVLQTRTVELRIHREDLDIIRDWALKKLPFIDAVEYLRVTKSRIEPFSNHETALNLQIEKMRTSKSLS